MSDEIELYRRFRPKTFKEVIGQPEAIRTLLGFVKAKTIPHAILVTGPSGCGKTTLARILQSKLECSDMDYVEINCASDRGIDMTRSIQQQMGMFPMNGKTRIWYLDECFASDTQVNTPSGEKPISSICKGDLIYNLEGVSKVKDVFKNKVELDRIVKLTFNNGVSLFTTKQHEFLTESGWVEAQFLNSELAIFTNFCYPSQDSNNLEETKDAICFDLSNMSEEIPNQGRWEKDTKNVLPSVRLQTKDFEVRENALCQEKEREKQIGLCLLQSGIYSEIRKNRMLFEIMRFSAKGRKSRAWTKRKGCLPLVQKRICKKEIKPQETLQHVLCGKDKDSRSYLQKEGVYQRSSRKNQQESQEVLSNSGREAICEGERKKTNRENNKTRIYNKGEGNEREKRHFACLAGRTWREWTTNRSPRKTVRKSRKQLENGIFNSYRVCFWGEWLPDELQSGLGQCKIETGCRNRWERPSIEKGYIERQQKTNPIREIRLESIEIYKPGSNEESFLGIISDKERNQGYVEFFDLQVEGHPSYFVEGVPVHNCSKVSPDGQASMLKSLEDIPNHVYFILATTDPHKLLNTIKTRCTEIKLNLLSTEALTQVVQNVCTKESITITTANVERLVKAADGSARKALVLLHQIRDQDESSRESFLVKEEVAYKKGDSIARLLMNPKTPWKDIAAAIRASEDEPEGVRRGIFGYAAAILVGGRFDPHAFTIMDIFQNPFYDVGTAKGMLVKCCADACRVK